MNTTASMHAKSSYSRAKSASQSAFSPQQAVKTLRIGHCLTIGLLTGALTYIFTDTFHWAYLAGMGAAALLYLRTGRSVSRREGPPSAPSSTASPGE